MGHDSLSGIVKRKLATLLMETEYDYLFKIVLIGDAGVGKTSIVRRYTDGIFTSAGIPTIGVDFCIKTLQIGSSAVKVCVCLITKTVDVVSTCLL